MNEKQERILPRTRPITFAMPDNGYVCLAGTRPSLEGMDD